MSVCVRAEHLCAIFMKCCWCPMDRLSHAVVRRPCFLTSEEISVQRVKVEELSLSLFVFKWCNCALVKSFKEPSGSHRRISVETGRT